MGPDTIQSVSVARRGYGSMAISNSTGSQILNILLGLGMPWTLCGLFGRPVPVPDHGLLQVMAYFQAVNVAVYTALLLLATAPTWRFGNHSKATLGRRKGALLILVYLTGLAAYAALALSR